MTHHPGDDGTTTLATGKRLPKSAPIFEAIGTLDELSSHIGLLLSLHVPDDVRPLLIETQVQLFGMSALLSGVERPAHVPDAESVAHLDAFIAAAPHFSRFILPGGCTAAAQCHVCRTVARRAERVVAALDVPCRAVALKYLNRLSTYFFHLALALNKFSYIEERKLP